MSHTSKNELEPEEEIKQNKLEDIIEEFKQNKLERHIEEFKQENNLGQRVAEIIPSIQDAIDESHSWMSKLAPPLPLPAVPASPATPATPEHTAEKPRIGFQTPKQG